MTVLPVMHESVGVEGGGGGGVGGVVETAGKKIQNGVRTECQL